MEKIESKIYKCKVAYFFFFFFFKKGDIILLKREQACPADILIIDSKDNNFHIDSFLLNGINTYTPKFPLKATSCILQLFEILKNFKFLKFSTTLI